MYHDSMLGAHDGPGKTPCIHILIGPQLQHWGSGGRLGVIIAFRKGTWTWDMGSQRADTVQSIRVVDGVHRDRWLQAVPMHACWATCAALCRAGCRRVDTTSTGAHHRDTIVSRQSIRHDTCWPCSLPFTLLTSSPGTTLDTLTDLAASSFSLWLGTWLLLAAAR